MDYEYVIQHRGGRGQTFEYELVYSGEGQSGEPFLAGLVDVEALEKAALPAPDGSATTATCRSLEGTCRPSEGRCRGGVGPESAPNRGGVGPANSSPLMEQTPKTASQPENTQGEEQPEKDRRSTTKSARTAAGRR
jgi:hypothetical protein